jgi:Cu-processing system permease protein
VLVRIGAIAFNTYREAVRARILHGLLALAFATCGYSLVVGAFSLGNDARVVSDLGAASISIYSLVVAIVIGATSLYRELELKTIFPVLARPIRRWEYLVGKFAGTLLTLTVFIAANSGVLLLALAGLGGKSFGLVTSVGLGSIALFGVLAWRMPRARTYLPIPWALTLVVAGAFLASGAPDDRQVVLGSAALTLAEVSVVSAVTLVFASFSSPFLTAIFTFGVFIVGRSADTLAHLPARVFGEPIAQTGLFLSKVVPNLMLYVPPRPLLTGEAMDANLPQYLVMATAHALAWTIGLLGFAVTVFRRRDFL